MSSTPNQFDPRLIRAVNEHHGKWPAQLVSGVMFFDGLKITQVEFAAYAKAAGVA